MQNIQVYVWLPFVSIQNRIKLPTKHKNIILSVPPLIQTFFIILPALHCNILSTQIVLKMEFIIK